MERGASISENGLYRWTLTRNWGGATARAVCWVMLNPSTADAEKDDPTLRSIIKRTEGWGYEALVVVNLNPFRSSSPTEARRHALPLTAQDTNACIVMREAQGAALVVAAWGNADWVSHADLNFGSPLYCIGTNANGTPKHPLARGKHSVPTWTEPTLWQPPKGEKGSNDG